MRGIVSGIGRTGGACVAILALCLPGCFYRGGGVLGAMAWTAIATAAIISAAQPPAPEVTYVPEPRPGFSWQSGYWTLDDGEWEWVEGRWIRDYPGYRWDSTHWVQDRSGHWRLLPGHWVELDPGPPPPAP